MPIIVLLWDIFLRTIPKYSCIVVIDYPRSGKIYGGEVAAPVFKEITDRICRKGVRLGVSKSLESYERMPRIGGGWSDELSYLCSVMGVPHAPFPSARWVRTRVSNRQVLGTSMFLPQQRMPEVRGMVLRDALCLLENASFKVKKIGTGSRVIYQYPSAGALVAKNSTIQLGLK